MATAVEDKHFFEGTEKLLEVWFSSTSNEDTRNLRTIERCHWEELLKLVQCEIISIVSDEDMDAYVLSESSMFVTSHRFILKTCGQTTLLLAVEPLLKLVANKCGFDKVQDVFYSRKNFTRPDKQHKIHRKFEDEVDHLDTMLKDGAAYCLGRMNRDCWYLYTIDCIGVMDPDQTLELLMWNMDQKKMKIFSKETCASGKEASEKSGISALIPGAQIDDFLFHPCGYSMNGLLPGGYYITIHVTPEPQCSYVSFETNVPQKSYHDLLKKILKVFSPGKFLMTIFANQESIAKDSPKDLENMTAVQGYVRNDHQHCLFKNYSLTYTHFSRPVL
ncbi:S-adenosylmethionine decarboxylase proenzyme-like [Liolophura sinensis]|uniref:S-adenosylmethionine decarboxylase proenzyme-like n=1 Tax=Liolophura sinensis TaxID=3198878 RepID=UPI0031584D48